MKHIVVPLIVLLLFAPSFAANGLARNVVIDRHEVVTRNNPHVNTLDTLSAFTVGNGHFAMTIDATGLQTFPERYSKGIPLGTFSDWAWHSFANIGNYKPADALVTKDFGKGHKELYSAQFKKPGRQRDASEWLRKNPHRLHLGCLGFDFPNANAVTHVQQTLDMWTGSVHSRFIYNGQRYDVTTVCDPYHDRVAVSIHSEGPIQLLLHFPYPTGGHSDDACNWNANDKHQTILKVVNKREATIDRVVDATRYSVALNASADADFDCQQNKVSIAAKTNDFSLVCHFLPEDSVAIASSREPVSFKAIAQTAISYWEHYWKLGGIVDFSHVADKRAREIERRTILSAYLLAVNDAGNTPPQETGLTYNSWFGKFHLEMIWWHQAQFALWGHPELLDRSLSWYFKAEPMAREIARRQGYEGVRWMKMTDPSAQEAPSNVGSYLVWQQPHPIYLAELLYRAAQAQAKNAAMDVDSQSSVTPVQVLQKYGRLVDETAEFMASFATYDTIHKRYILKGCIPAQETLPADTTFNPPFELSYWHYALETAQQWRLRRGLTRNAMWDKVLASLSPLAYNADSLYLAAESATDTYTNTRCTSDHPALLGALGVLPDCQLIDDKVMSRTLDWVWQHWNWATSWGWDFPMTAMTAARLNRPETAVDALVMPMQKNTYLNNGHNYQDNRLRVYLPGNGGLLTAVAMMCAGWDGSKEPNPGFPRDWDVRWEGLLPLP